MSGSVKNIEDPEYYFGLACREHARVNLFFTLDMCHISNIRATCVMVKNGHLVASAPIGEIESQPIVWGTDTSGYFMVRDVDIVHCHFKSRLARIYNGPPNAMFLVFPLPESIDHQQRRSSRRITLNEEQAAAFKIWYGEIEEKDEKLPAMRWLSLAPPKCSLGDISSSGLRLDMPQKEALAERIDTNDLVLLRGDFGQKGKALPLSVIALVRRKMPWPENNGMLSVGCHFLEWRKHEGLHSHTWFRPEADAGIPAIAQWISRNFRGSRA